MRVLDLDLDFFLHGTAHYVSYRTEERLDPEEFPPWSVSDAFSFLEKQCLLVGKLPGFAVEHHSELLYLLGERICDRASGLSMEIVHVDAHADLGLGDAAYRYILTELAFEPIAARWEVLKQRGLASRDEMSDLGAYSVNDGNWLAFAVACGWVADFTYVWNTDSTSTGRPGDLMRPLMKDYDLNSDHLQITAVKDEEFHRYLGGCPPVPVSRDPAVSFKYLPWRRFQAEKPFECVCLTRSPEYTPAEADPIFDQIRAQFVDESVYA